MAQAANGDMADVLKARVQALEEAVKGSLRLNQKLNQELELCMTAVDQTAKEKAVLEQRLKQLRHQTSTCDELLQVLQGQQLPDEGQPMRGLRGHGPDEHASTSGDAFSPSETQLRALQLLVARGKAAGWLISPNEIELGDVLGQGAFGTTFRGTWRGAQVAVKCVRISSRSELTLLLREVEALSLLRHPNIVPFLGACLPDPAACASMEALPGTGDAHRAEGHVHGGPHPGAGPHCPPLPPHAASKLDPQQQQQLREREQRASHRFWLLSEFMPGGNLSQWLHHPGGASVAGAMNRHSFIDRTRMGLEVARGMRALECMQPRVLHRDLKPSNVFVDGAGHARVADFGLARRLLAEERSELTGETGTYQYMAPEVFRHEVYDGKADVWSWGVLLVELATNCHPYAHTYLTPAQIACAVAAEELRPEIPKVPEYLVELQLAVHMACDFDPAMRPDFEVVVDIMTKALTKLEAREAQAQGMLSSLQRGLSTSFGAVLERVYPLSATASLEQRASAALPEPAAKAGAGAATGREPALPQAAST